MLNHIHSAQMGILDQLPGLGLSDRLTPGVKKIVMAAVMATAAMAGAPAAHAFDPDTPAPAPTRYESSATGTDVAKGAGLGAAIGAIGATLMKAHSALPAAAIGGVIGAVATHASKTVPVKAATAAPAYQPSSGVTQPQAGNRALEPHRISQFAKLAERFDVAQASTLSLQDERRARDLDSTLGGDASPSPVSVKGVQSAAEQQANFERNALGRQFLTAYAKAVDMGYDMRPIDDAAHRIFTVMKTANPQPYASLRADANSYISRVSAAHRPRY